MSAAERIRVQLDSASSGWWANIDIPEMSDDDRKVAAGLIDAALAAMAAAGIDDVHQVLKVLVLEQIRDTDAYERVAESRGVLAL